MVKLISNIDQKIEKVLKNLKLVPKEKPIDFILRTKKRKHRYSVMCKDKKGRFFIFSARLHDSKTEKERMIAEVKMANFLKRKKIKFFPRYLKAKIEKDFEWVLREYFEGESLESKKEIERLPRPLKEKEIKEICKILIEMQKLKCPFLKKKEEKKFLLLPQEIEKRKILKKEEREKIKELFRKNLKLVKENNYFCHGDFHIGNLILTNEGIKVIDLESAMLSNFAFDACFFWIRLWREKKTRQKFLKTFISFLPKEKLEKFKKFFQLDALFLGFHSFCARPREYKKEMRKKRKQYFLNVMKKAILGFEALKEI